MNIRNSGIFNSGTLAAQGPVVAGDNATVTQSAPAPTTTEGADEVSDTDIGVLTVLSVETRAVVETMSRLGNYRVDDRPDGIRLHRATVPGGRPVEVAAMQVVEPGQRSAALAVERFRRLCSPAVVVVVGIAGGIHADVAPGDVVFSDEVIYYDLRKEVRDRTVRRGQELRTSVLIRHLLNHYFSQHGEPCERPDAGSPGGAYRMHRGPIGSGEAVVACSHAEIRRYLRAFNDKVLAVETEAGAVAQACYEAGTESAPANWLSVRGIADMADEHKSDAYHAVAARHAAAALSEIIQYLPGR